MNASFSAQRGVVLLVGMIMLVLLTLFAIAAINMSNVNLRVTANTQARDESLAAGQQAIEQVISTNFPLNPQPVTVNVDINNDGNSDYTVAVEKPVCLNAVPIKTVDLDIANADDVACFASGAASAPGVVPVAPSGNSLCSNSQWDVKANVTDPAHGSGATVSIHQGVGQRVAIGTTC